MSGERDNRVSPVEIIHFKTIMKGLEILKKSGATQACQELQPSSWTNVEVKYLLLSSCDNPSGIRLWIRFHPVTEHEDHNYLCGLTIAVDTYVEDERVTVLCCREPVEIKPDPESGWTEELKIKVREAIGFAFENPGTYIIEQGYPREDFIFAI